MKQEEIKRIIESFDNSDNVEELIQALKDHGATQMECTRTLATELKYTLREADESVLNSMAWRESREANEGLRDNFFKHGNDT